MAPNFKGRTSDGFHECQFKQPDDLQRFFKTLLHPSQSGVDPRNCSSLQTREIMQRKSSGSLPPENSQVRADQGQQNLAATIDGRQLGIIAAIPIDLLDRAGCEQSRDRPNQTLHATRNDRNPPLADHRPGCSTGSQATLRLPACCSTKSDHITPFCRHCRPWPNFCVVYQTSGRDGEVHHLRMND